MKPIINSHGCPSGTLDGFARVPLSSSESYAAAESCYIGLVFPHKLLFRGTKLYEVDTNAVIGKRLTMHVTDGSANLEELLVLLNCCLVLSQVVIQNTGRVISTSFVS